MSAFTGPLHFFRAFVSRINQGINMGFLHLTGICFVGLLPCVIIDNIGWKRNKKVARTSRRRMLPGVSLDMAWVVRCAHQPHRVEEGEKTGERTIGLHSNLFVTLPVGVVKALLCTSNNGGILLPNPPFSSEWSISKF
jgi:hypothetical protein